MDDYKDSQESTPPLEVWLETSDGKSFNGKLMICKEIYVNDFHWFDSSMELDSPPKYWKIKIGKV